jgi:hypothetical protein
MKKRKTSHEIVSFSCFHGVRLTQSGLKVVYISQSTHVMRTRRVLAGQPPDEINNLDATPPSTPSSSVTLTPDSQDSELVRMADPASALTQGALLRCTQGEEVDQPVVQCVQIKQMNNQNGVERWRIVMNDGLNFMQGMLSTREYDARR